MKKFRKEETKRIS